MGTCSTYMAVTPAECPIPTSWCPERCGEVTRARKPAAYSVTAGECFKTKAPGEGHGARTETLGVELEHVVIDARSLAVALPIDGPGLADDEGVGRGVLELEERGDDGLPRFLVCRSRLK